MRLFITPFIHKPRSGTNYFLTQGILSIAKEENLQIALSASKDNHFRNVSLYPCPTHHPSIFSWNRDTNYEEWLYHTGISKENYLKEDVEQLIDSMRAFKPDKIITIDRIAALIAGHVLNIPVYSIIDSTIYKAVNLSPAYLKPVNQILSSYHLPQVLHIADLYDQYSQTISFNPLDIFIKQNNVLSYGSMAPIYQKSSLMNRVCIYLQDLHIPKYKLHKIIEEAFLGSPYVIYLYYPGIHPYTKKNIHAIAEPRANLIPGSICIIHDGDPYLFNMTLTYGIVQLMINDHRYDHTNISRIIQRNDLGIVINKEHFTMASLYENFREVLNEDDYQDHIDHQKEAMKSLPNLLDFIQDIQQ